MTSTPGVSVGTISIDIRSCGGFSGLVTTITIRKAAKRAFDENHFSPSITHSSPSRHARQVNSLGSAPACGSVIEKVETISPFISGFRYRSEEHTPELQSLMRIS